MRNKTAITSEEIERRFDALPDDIAGAFESADTGKRLFEIGRLQGLAIDKIGDIAREVGYLMLGLVPADEFVADLAEIAGDKEKAKNIAAEINQRILLPIRESMKKLYGDKWRAEAIAGAEAAPAKPPPAKAPLAPPPGPRPPAPPPKPELPRKPEPLIITPLPMSEEQKRKIEEIKRMEELIAPRPMPAPPPIPKKPPEAPKPLPKVPAEETRTDKEKPAPIIAPLGIQPRPVMPPADAYQRAREAVKKELKEFQKAEEPKAAAPPSPYVITKEELQKEIEKFRPKPEAEPAATVVPPAAPAPKPSPAAPPSPPKPETPAPLKLPQEKIPKPQAPDKYAQDPYKEPFE